MTVELTGIFCDDEKLWCCWEPQFHEHLQPTCTYTKIMGYVQVTSMSFWSRFIQGGLTISLPSCADFINPRVFGFHSQLPLFLALLFCVMHTSHFFRGLTLPLEGKLPVMHYDPRRTRNPELLNNWVFILLKQSLRLAQRSDNCYILQPKGGDGWGRWLMHAQLMGGVEEELWCQPRWVKTVLLGNTVLPASFIRNRLLIKWSSIIRMDS